MKSTTTPDRDVGSSDSSAEDSRRLDKLEKYLSDPAKNISGPYPQSPGWEFGYNGGMAYVIDGGGVTLREAIDSLPNAAVRHEPKTGESKP